MSDWFTKNFNLIFGIILFWPLIFVSVVVFKVGGSILDALLMSGLFLNTAYGGYCIRKHFYMKDVYKYIKYRDEVLLPNIREAKNQDEIEDQIRDAYKKADDLIFRNI